MGTISQPWNFPDVAENFPPLRILVVDDEPLIRWSLMQTLSDAGHQTVEAIDGASAVRAVSEATTPFDVALLDFRLPDSNDLGLLTQLRRLSPATQVILMTAYGTPEVVEGALDLGVFRVVPKPLDMSDVKTLVAQAHQAGR
jgi:DNA-binding NtrC family response regulator